MLGAITLPSVSTGFSSDSKSMVPVSIQGMSNKLEMSLTSNSMEMILFGVIDAIHNTSLVGLKALTMVQETMATGFTMLSNSLMNIGNIAAKDLGLEETQTNIAVENEKDEDKEESLSDDNEGKGLLTNSFKGGVAKVMQRIKEMSLVESLIALGVGLALLMFNFDKVASILGGTVKFFDEQVIPRVKAFGSSLKEYYTNLFDGLFGDTGFFTVIGEGFGDIKKAIDSGDGKAAINAAGKTLIKGTTSAISVIGTTILGAIKVVAKTVDPDADLSSLDKLIKYFNDLPGNVIKKLEADQIEFDKTLKEKGKIAAAGVLLRQTYDNYIANTLNGISKTFGIILKPIISDESYKRFMTDDYSFANIKDELGKAFDNLGEAFDRMKDSIRVFSNEMIDSVNVMLPDFMKMNKIPKKDDQFEIDTLASMEKQKLITPDQYEPGGFMYKKYQKQREKVIEINPSVVIPNNDFERDFGVDANVGDIIDGSFKPNTQLENMMNYKDNIMTLKTKELKDVASVSQSESTSIVVPNFITDNKKIDNSNNSSQAVTVTDQRVDSMEGSSNAVLNYYSNIK